MRKLEFLIIVIFTVFSVNTVKTFEMAESPESMEVNSCSDVETEIKLIADDQPCSAPTGEVSSSMEVDMDDEPLKPDLEVPASSKTDLEMPANLLQEPTKEDFDQPRMPDLVAIPKDDLDVPEKPELEVPPNSRADTPLNFSSSEPIKPELGASGEGLQNKLGASGEGLQNINKDLEGEHCADVLTDSVGPVGDNKLNDASDEEVSTKNDGENIKDGGVEKDEKENLPLDAVSSTGFEKEPEELADSSSQNKADIAKEADIAVTDKKVSATSDLENQNSESDAKCDSSMTEISDTKNKGELCESKSHPLGVSEENVGIDSENLEKQEGQVLTAAGSTECAHEVPAGKDPSSTQVEVGGDDDDGELMGFHFNEAGELRDKYGKKFEFRNSEDNDENQKRYEILGEKITEYVYKLLETDFKLKRHYIPFNAAKGDPRSFFFASQGALTTTDKLLVLIHGNGVVRAGQWARKIIINDNLKDGTQIPYIEKAMSEGYEIVVLNTNLNTVPPDVDIPHSEDPETHALYVWDNYIVKSKAKSIGFVAHSYGGIVTLDLACKRRSQFLKRVFAVALTDSVHSMRYSDATRDIMEFYELHGLNWVSSNLPLDKPVEMSWRRSNGDAPQVSAGDTRHEWTSASAINSVFKFLTCEYKARLSSSSSCQTF